MISALNIKNFRSVESVDIKTAQTTVLVGQNDAGKSNILRALNLFFNNETDVASPLHFVSDFNAFTKVGQRKAKEIEVTLTFSLPSTYHREGFSPNIVWTKSWREDNVLPFSQSRMHEDGQEIASRSKISALLDRIRFTYVPAIKDRAFFADLQGRLYDVLSSVAAAPLRDSASIFENQLQLQLGELLKSISQVFEGQSSMRLPDNLRQIFENLEISNSGIPLSRRGDGIKIRHIPMILSFISQKQDQILNRGGVRYTHIWGFEEPENNVEMVSCFKMASDFAEIINRTENHQLFLTTHSPVFYRMDQQSKCKDCMTIFVSRESQRTNLSPRDTSSLDENMGLMPIVAPFVALEKKKFDELQETLKQVREISGKQIPTVFVEGPSDVIILDKAIDLFFKDQKGKIIFTSGGENDYGSAAAVKSRALAWVLEMRHRPVADRVKSLALFDCDEAGDREKRELIAHLDALSVNTTGMLAIKSLPIPKSYVVLKKAGFNVEVNLESFYNDAFWSEASKKGWLEPLSNPSKVLSKAMVDGLFQSGKNPVEGQSEEVARRLRNNFATDKKVLAAKNVKGRSVGESKIILAEAVGLLEAVFKELKIQA